jgi:hypothetical protein
MAVDVAVVGSNPGGSTPCAIFRDPPKTGSSARAGEVKSVMTKQIKLKTKYLFISYAPLSDEPLFSVIRSKIG